jgi:hypothetical protein
VNGDERSAALAEIAHLAREHALTLDEVAAALGSRASAAPDPAESGRRGRGVLVRVFGFLGGTFVFAGIGVFIALQWDEMNSAARVIVTLGSGVAAFALAALARRDPRVERASTPLYLVAAALQPTGMLVAFAEFGSGGDWRWASLVTAVAMAVQFGLAYAVAGRSTPLFVSISFAVAGLWTGLDLLDSDGSATAITVGTSLILAAVWADRSGHRDITPLWYCVGAVACLSGVFDVVESTPAEVTFIGAAALFVYLSVVLRSRTLLVVATLANLAYTGYFTAEHFADSVGWPLALVAFGVFMLGLSALAVRIDRQYVRSVRPS